MHLKANVFFLSRLHTFKPAKYSLFQAKSRGISPLKIQFQQIRGISGKIMVEGLTKFEDVQIDEDATYKYVLIKLSAGGDSKSIVRGHRRADYHADVFDDIELEALKYKVKASCLGGGRIKHDSKSKTIDVYGYSVGFGRADHQVAVDLIKKKYTDYEVSWSNDGY